MRDEDIRIDKWLWAIRVYKTRSLAADACKNGRVRINDALAKPARTIKIGDIIEVRKSPIFYKYEVKELLKSRVGAKLVEQYCNDLTPDQEIIKLDMVRANLGGYRDRGAGRPTKKERRLLDDWQQSDE